MTAADAAVRPVYALESGPAAGVVASLGLAQALGFANAITFDMGGTTAKASLIENGRVSRSQEYEVGAELSAGSRLLRGSGELIRIPTIDIAEVGAGGGSLAWLDPAGALQVGPRSAGAVPGPACYGRGGEEPTVTDANVVLGYIPTGPLASGDLTVSADRAAEAVGRVAAALGLTPDAAARGIHRLANASMMRALRAVSTERGRDPADFVLVAYGGAGPIHAAALAAELGVRTAIVPPLAGLFSAVGLLFARTEFHDVRFCASTRARATCRSSPARGRDARRSRGARRRPRRGRVAPVADVRYRGQSWSIAVDFPGAGRDRHGCAVERFEAEHERLYGTRLEEGSPVEIRAIRLDCRRPAARRRSRSRRRRRSLEAATTRVADFGEAQAVEAVRSRAAIGRAGAGPLLVDEYDTTVVVPPGWSRRLDGPNGALVLEHVAVETERAAARRHEPTRSAADRRERARDASRTRWRRRSSAPPTRRSCATRWTSRPRSAGRSGETIAQAVTIPLQLGSIPNAMKTLLERFGDSFAPGDVYMVNDPFDGASHTPDIFIVKPSFAGGELVGFARHRRTPRRPGRPRAGDDRLRQHGGLPGGPRIPWLKLYDRGEPVETIFEIFRANVRVPHELHGDLNAQVAACTIGDRGLQELAAR